MKKRVKGKPTEPKPESIDEEEPEVAPEIQELADWAEKIAAAEPDESAGDGR